jgi:V/A-type H+-transporting ATPase subunit A
MDISAIIANFYSRAGFVHLNNGETGSITFIGTVSPAGGNLKEPVTESTKKTARCFYALEQSRADSKRYPAIDPIDSYSKYLEYAEVIKYLDEIMEMGWADKVTKLKDILISGKENYDQINILGDDSVPIEYHINYNKSELIDFFILQQDAFDKVDSSTPLERQKYMVNLVLDICDTTFDFDQFEETSTYFKKMINVMRQMNYHEFKSASFNEFEKELKALISQKNGAKTNP